MRILALVTDAFGGNGGIAQYNRDFLTALSACPQVSEIDVLPRMAPRPSHGLPPKLRQAPARQGRLDYSRDALRRAADRTYDLVFCGHLYMAPLALLAARRARAKLVLQLHGREAWPAPTRLQRKAAEAADRVLAVSRYTRAQFLTNCRIAPERVAVVPNTVRGIFSPGGSGDFRSARSLDKARILLTVGRLDAVDSYKGHDEVIRILPQVRRALPDVHYVIAGEGDDRDRLERLARSTGVEDAVHFIGAVDSATLQAAYRAADLFVMPSTGEGFGIVYLEAMASGTPALGLRAGGAPDALGDGELGFLCDQDDLAAAIVSALSGPAVDSKALSERTLELFGTAPFQAAVARQLAALEDGDRSLALTHDVASERS